MENKHRLLNYFPISIGEIKDLKSTLKYIRSKIKAAKDKKQFAFVIEEKATDELVGYLIVKNLNWTIRECELAYWIGQGFEGQGIMSYSMRQIIRFCFDYLEIFRIFLRIDPINFKSKGLALRNGFSLHHVAEKEYKRGDDQWIDVEYWELLNTT